MTTPDPEVVEPPRPFVAGISAFWEKARELYRVLLPIRFSFLTLVVFAGVLLLTDQGNDAIAALAEGNPTWTRTSIFALQLLFAVIIALFATQIWYWSRQLLRVQFPQQPNPLDWPGVVKWVPRVLGVVVFAIAIVTLAHVRSMYGSELRKPANVLLGIIIALAIEAAMFVGFTIFRRKKIGAMTTVRNLRDFGPMTLRILGLTAVLALVVLLASTFAVQQVARIGTISVLVLALGLWVALGGVLIYAGMQARIPILTWLLIFAIVISPLADNHAVRTVAGPLPARVNADAAFATWYQRLVAETKNAPVPRPVFIVATEGGGIRAGYWTAAVLTSLSDTIPGFTEHLFAISGVSGGSVGAATYRALLAEPAARGKLHDRAREALAYDALAPAITAFTQQDLVQRFLPLGFPDRAKALEQGWERGWMRAMKGSTRFSDGFLATTSVGADRLPSLFLNGTLVETGQRVITSNVRIDNRFAAAVDAFDAIGSDVPMSTGAHNSARFPYVSPVGTLRDRHIADAGYFENSGAATAADLIDVIRRHPDAKNIRPYVIIIDCKHEVDKPVKVMRFANELFAPIRTLLRVRGAHASAAVTELREHTLPADQTTFRLVQHQGERFPLGWLLAARTRDQIDKQMGPTSLENGKNVKAIADVLRAAMRQDPVWTEAVQNEQAAQAEQQQ